MLTDVWTDRCQEESHPGNAEQKSRISIDVSVMAPSLLDNTFYKLVHVAASDFNYIVLSENLHACYIKDGSCFSYFVNMNTKLSVISCMVSHSSRLNYLIQYHYYTHDCRSNL